MKLRLLIFSVAPILETDLFGCPANKHKCAVQKICNAIEQSTISLQLAHEHKNKFKTTTKNSNQVGVFKVITGGLAISCITSNLDSDELPDNETGLLSGRIPGGVERFAMGSSVEESKKRICNIQELYVS